MAPIDFEFPLMPPLVYKPLLNVYPPGMDGLVFFSIVGPGLLMEVSAPFTSHSPSFSRASYASSRRWQRWQLCRR